MSTLDRLQRAVRGTAEWVGRQPITEPVLPRLALSSWTATVRAQSPPVRKAVLVTAFRNRTWIEWAVYATCQLRRLGVATTLVYSGSEVRRVYPWHRVPGAASLGFWAGVARIPDLRLVDLDDWSPNQDDRDRYSAFARELAPTVAAYDLHVEENEEGPQAHAYRRAVQRAEGLLAETGAAFERIVRENPVSRVICYSGLIGRSPALQEAARRLGIDVLTVEGWAWRPGHMICNLNAPALEYNLEGWLHATPTWDESRERATDRLLQFQEGALSRVDAAAFDLHRVQRTTVTAPLPEALAAFQARPGPSFLLATNVVGDSSMLRRDPLFRSQRDWLRQTIAFFRGRPGFNLVVRAHPDEAYLRRKVVVRMGEVARELAEGAPNVFVIGGDEDVSSYSLMPGLAGGLVWISSIGADMVARGIPVVAAARPKYQGLGLVEEPRTIPAYWSALERLATTKSAPSDEQRTRARRYLDLVFSQFSFEAFSPSYRANDLFLEGPGAPPDAEVFYRIVAGDLPPETPPERETRRVA